EWMRRGHSKEQSVEAILKIASETKVNLGIHLMFGLPGETDKKIIETAELCNSLPISNVKLHNLHILENTPLADDFRAGLFSPIERELYAHRVKLFLQHLAPHIYVHRLAALSSRWEELVAPPWTKDKMGTHQYIVDYIRSTESFQSELYSPKNEEEQRFKNELRLKGQRVVESLELATL
ncbi:MAG: TIGR01212 family radical SAM protein, partial [Pseudobdellovibrionaceae bacterium]